MDGTPSVVCSCPFAAIYPKFDTSSKESKVVESVSISSELCGLTLSGSPVDSEGERHYINSETSQGCMGKWELGS